MLQECRRAALVARCPNYADDVFSVTVPYPHSPRLRKRASPVAVTRVILYVHDLIHGTKTVDKKDRTTCDSLFYGSRESRRFAHCSKSSMRSPPSSPERLAPVCGQMQRIERRFDGHIQPHNEVRIAVFAGLLSSVPYLAVVVAPASSLLATCHRSTASGNA